MSQAAKQYPPLLLASSSSSRQQLLQRLHLPFETYAPNIDETAIPAETPRALAHRLSVAKAHKAQQHFPEHVIIAGDQTADCDGVRLGKPLSEKKAEQQLLFCSGKTVTFHSGLCVSYKHHQLIVIEPFKVTFRTLTPAEIRHYITLDQPLWSAGSFKCESLGISLFDCMEGSDMTALVGLPLIKLTTMLRTLGINPLLA